MPGQATPHVIVGIDGSAPSLRAAAWASAVAETRGATLLVLHAHVPEQSEVRPEYHERLVAAQRDELHGWCQEALGDRPRVEELVDGDPRDVLLDAVERVPTILLVVAAEGASGSKPGLLRLGSVAEHLAHQATVPLAIVPSGGSHVPQRVMVAVDGSPHSEAAVRWLAELALGTALDVTAVTVVDTALPSVGATGAGWAVAAEQCVRTEWASPLNAAGVPFEALAVSEGPVVEALLETAATLDADLIVMGMQGTGWFSGVRIGGKALQVIHRADRTVVIVPPEPTP